MARMLLRVRSVHDLPLWYPCCNCVVRTFRDSTVAARRELTMESR